MGFEEHHLDRFAGQFMGLYGGIIITDEQAEWLSRALLIELEKKRKRRQGTEDVKCGSGVEAAGRQDGLSGVGDGRSG